MDARLTVTFDETTTSAPLQKSGSVGLTVDEIKKCIKYGAGESAPDQGQALGD